MKTFKVTIQQELIVTAESLEDARSITILKPPTINAIGSCWSLRSTKNVKIIKTSQIDKGGV